MKLRARIFRWRLNRTERLREAVPIVGTLTMKCGLGLRAFRITALPPFQSRKAQQ